MSDATVQTESLWRWAFPSLNRDIMWYIYAVYVFVNRLSSVPITKESRLNHLIVKCFVFIYSGNVALLCRQTWYYILFIKTKYLNKDLRTTKQIKVNYIIDWFLNALKSFQLISIRIFELYT